mmetsp:Transcript_28997/g.55584  ORF Transcript_28997/g.55584 Transcript_28997/m.55584 type:complete len:333 (+) Transcript_28997:2574-3572(+)|eukprot:CAMPEP_0114249432 /NCGR_PEP_ID=MMETSP0058-20121206/14139_1 /TAXON_ID=36894 /ORGANISM="Pyramimonas parkeae, CCMP726" /LENGTH=332 /DNA_ID=CAMNT_0001362977 /DNA_START=2574 /DNA_END=3572 /DNA_ORIENTATION=-
MPGWLICIPGQSEIMGMDSYLKIGATVVACWVPLHVFSLSLHMRACALCQPGMWCARKFLKTIKTDKFDKESVCVTALQKCGSTLLCYIVSLINMENKIEKFRNDFDILPMLSFPTRLIAQNFNQRQDGKYQLFKINGRFKDVEKDLGGKYKNVWLCRDINGYFCSVYWWVLAFYPTVDKSYFPFKWVSFNLFKWLYFKEIAREHIDEMYHVYTRLQAGEKFLYMVTYDALVKNKEFEVKKLAKAMGIELPQKDIDSICNKTSKRSMLEYDRFDPVKFGDGEGVSKVNLQPHKHKLAENDLKWYDDEFAKKFAGTGIKNYADFSAHILAIGN